MIRDMDVNQSLNIDEGFANKIGCPSTAASEMQYRHDAVSFTSFASSICGMTAATQLQHAG